MKSLTVFSGLLVLASVFLLQATIKSDLPKYPDFSAEAHRGGRGLMPENTVPAMLSALDFPKVTTLEMDTYISRDGKVVVTHDAFLNPSYISLPDGSEIPSDDKRKYAIYKMDYDVIKSFIVGRKNYPQFPQQKKTDTHIPLLADLIDSVQLKIKQKNRIPCFYDIEIKSSEKGDGTLHPDYKEYAQKVINVIRNKGISNYVIIQSFDKRVIRFIHQNYPEIRLNYLVNNNKSYAEYITELGFKPFILGVSYKGFNPDIISKAHADGVKVITATVNDKNEISRLKSLGIDGIMTDYLDFF